MGKSGSVRVSSLDRSGLLAMHRHELRLDKTGQARRIREVDPLLYDVDGDTSRSLVDAYDAHVAGAKRNKASSALASHAFIQFPTDIDLDVPGAEEKLLKSAVEFINKTHGGRAVFHARLDRDEAGRHGVDVFYAALYEKKTKQGSSTWVSLSKHAKDLAKLHTGKSDVRSIGQGLQDAFHSHLLDDFGSWVERGVSKSSAAPDRVEPEIYKLRKERERLDQSRVEKNDRETLQAGFFSALTLFGAGKIVGVVRDEAGKPHMEPSASFASTSEYAIFRGRYHRFMSGIAHLIKPYVDIFSATKLSISDRQKCISRARQQSGFDM